MLCLAAGIALCRYGGVPDNGHLALNGFIINLALAAPILLPIHNVQVDTTLLYFLLVPWLLFMIGAGLFYCISRVFDLSPETTGALMLTGGLGNTSFIGLPMIEAFYGKSGMALCILIDQLGTYLVLSTPGITIACIFSRGTESLCTIAWRVATFPPLIALVVAGALLNVAYGAIVATQYGLNATLITMMVGFGTPLAFATAPAWWELMAIF